MTTTGLDLLDQAIAEANRWVQEVLEDLDETLRHRGYSALRAVLHAIRDFLPFSDAVALARRLPPVVRGFYFDGWRRAEGPSKDRSPEAFLACVAERLIEVPELQPDGAARAVFRLLARRAAEGSLPDFRATWPAPLDAFWPAAGSAAPLSDEERRARARLAKDQIQAAIEGARREGVPEEELPAVSDTPRARPRRKEGAP